MVTPLCYPVLVTEMDESKLRSLRTVRSCPAARFSYECPKQWTDLAETDQPDVRHCNACNESVYFCRTDEETIARAIEGKCVARAEPDPGGLRPPVLGRVSPPTAAEIEALEWSTRETAIERSLSSEKLGDDRRCPSCSYPVPDWRSRCFVCHTHVGLPVGDES